MSDILNIARDVFDTEIQGLIEVRDQLDDGFEKLVKICVECLDNGGKLVLSGVGKSGHIGQKLAATLASTGSQSVFMHPVEALHGDLGILQDKDVLLALSYSGETDELLTILPAAKRLGVNIVAITGYPESRLVELSDLAINMTVAKEACPFNLAPTTTAVSLLALGDALAIVLLKVRGFTKEDYGRLHPGGAIGRAVTMRISDIMRSGDRLALVSPDQSVKETLLTMTSARSGSSIIVDQDGKLLGIFSDGDFRRHVENDLKVLDKSVGEVMTANPICVQEDQLAVEVMKIIEDKHIDDVIVVDESRRVVGLVDVQDLPGLKLM